MVSCVILTVICDVVIYVMCARVLQYVSIDFVIVHCLKVFKITFSKLFENVLNITIEVNANGCRPENGRILLSVQCYKMVYFMMQIIVLIIYVYAYLNL